MFDLQNGRDNVPRFLEASWDLWFENLLMTFDAICFLYRVFYVPELAAYLRVSSSEKRRAIALGTQLAAKVPECNLLISRASR